MFSQAMSTTPSPFDRPIALAFWCTPWRSRAPQSRLCRPFGPPTDGAVAGVVQRGPSEGRALTLGPRVQSPQAEGFRTPALCRRAGLDAGPSVRKPRKEETAGRKGRCLVGRGATYGDFGVADGALVGLRGPVARIVVGGSEDDGVFRGRGCERRVWARRLEEERRPCEDIAFLLQRAVGGEEKRRCAAGSAATIMRCRS